MGEPTIVVLNCSYPGGWGGWMVLRPAWAIKNTLYQNSKKQARKLVLIQNLLWKKGRDCY